MRCQTKIAFVHAEHGHNDKGIGAGIASFVKEKPRWQLVAWPDPTYESLAFLKKQGCVGAIVNVPTADKAERLRQAGIPIIAYSILQRLGNTPFISTDSEQVAQMAFDYFVAKQFKHYAFFGLTEARWSVERLESFSRIASRGGGTLHVFKSTGGQITNNLSSFVRLWIDSAMARDSRRLVEWLKALPKPVAILASCDILGCFLSTFVQESGFVIPNEIAVLGIDNNESICNICNAPLSSIALNLNKAGYEAAALLDRLISGKEKAAGQQIKIEPIRVVERASTDILGIEDMHVIKAIRYIHGHADEPLHVGEIARHTGVSKRLLQWKFNRFLKRSVHEEMVQARFQKARALLVETPLSIEEIASRSGFGTTAKIRKAFLDITGLLPHKYRQVHQPHM